MRRTATVARACARRLDCNNQRSILSTDANQRGRPMATMAKVIANNDVVHIAWSFDQPVAGCAGFLVERQPADGSAAWTTLTSLLEFEDRKDPNVVNKSTKTNPVEGFRWRDFLDATSRDIAVRYRITAMAAKDGGYAPLPGLTPIVTDPVTATEKLTGANGPIDVYFNRGILSTQALARLVDQYGGANLPALNKALDDPNGQARAKLAGELPKGVLSQLDRLAAGPANDSTCHAALYELTDKVLIDRLLAAKSRLHIVLSNNSGDKTGGYDSANKPARDELAGSGAELISRYLPDGRSIGHNKFMVYSEGGKPLSVLTGSTNWTQSGLCTRTTMRSSSATRPSPAGIATTGTSSRPTPSPPAFPPSPRRWGRCRARRCVPTMPRPPSRLRWPTTRRTSRCGSRPIPPA